jgi:hypothetical protein
MGLVTPADDAVMLVVPVVIVEASPELSIVATAVLLETHVDTFVISNTPAQVVAMAVNCFEVPTPTKGFVGVTAIDWMQPTVTVTWVDPEIVGISVDVAVTDAVPWVLAVTSPPALTVATPVPVTSTMLHVTLESGRTPSS